MCVVSVCVWSPSAVLEQLRTILENMGVTTLATPGPRKRRSLVHKQSRGLAHGKREHGGLAWPCTLETSDSALYVASQSFSCWLDLHSAVESLLELICASTLNALLALEFSASKLGTLASCVNRLLVACFAAFLHFACLAQRGRKGAMRL